MSDDTETFLEGQDTADEELDRKQLCRESLRKFFAANFQPGSLLEMSWLYDAMGVPAPDTMNSYEAGRDCQFRFMSRFEDFQQRLLLDHNIALSNVRGRGYRIVLPGEQSTWALNEATRELRKALSKGAARARHVNLNALSVEERQMQNSDLNRIKGMREMIRQDIERAARRARYNESI